MEYSSTQERSTTSKEMSMNMIEKMKLFSSWDQETREGCVLIHAMSDNTIVAAITPTTPVTTEQTQLLEPMQMIEHTIKPINSTKISGPFNMTEEEIKQKLKKVGGPRKAWADDDRLTLWIEFEKGNIDWEKLGRAFNRTSSAIMAQYHRYIHMNSNIDAKAEL